MITLEEEPALLSFSKNDIIYKFSTDNYVTNVGVKASKEIRIFPVNDDEEITIEWEKGSITFVAASALDNSGLKVRKYTGSLGSAAPKNLYLRDSLIPDLNTNELFFQTFNASIRVESTSVWWLKIEAREPGTDFSITITTLIENYDVESTTAGQNKTVRENFKIVTEVLVYDETDTLKSLTTLEEIPNDENIAEFNISAILDRYMAIRSALPDYDVNEVSEANNVISRFYLRYREVYGDPQEDYLVQNTSDRYVLMGGLKKQDWPGNTVLYRITTDPCQFLTWQPDNKVISKKQREYLYLYNNSIVEGIKVAVSFQDFTMITFDLTPGATDKVVSIPVGYEQLSLNEIDSEENPIIKYSVFAYNSDLDPASETRIYYVDQNEYTNERYFIYRNSLGGYDTFRAIGDSEVSINPEYDTSERILTSGYSSQTGQRVRSNLTYDEVIEVGTGLLDKDNKIALMEFVLSREAYEIINDKFVSIDIQNKEELVFSDADDVHSMVLKYKYNFTNRSYNR